ncbi:DNA methyltransferase [Methanococcus aeolicus]|uniref:Type II methyltransferase n=1 Tax=Methanococcus aeolicus (strain ATCC BAA-1280 / DSM 17508 / OCM 812 / Nankai-3) TaxID=419665 RepID=A6UTG2_META3|nr:DNA methyltransferase [Methanococcus aeolicus]ABR55784.1 DNA methylase N-4/N-6 domain protein [Methanococcus aeolicus Nankai-3]UXM84110.1 DNA methyltransferase [Methanococcus aeolicus]
MKTFHNVIIRDSRNMVEIPDNSVHLIITSPPYWQLKDYGVEEQIGFNDSYEEYINNLNLVWKECYRVLHPGCRMVINIGDQFARSVYYGRYKVIPIRTEIIKFAETIGFDYMGAIVWQKNTTMNTTGGASVMGSYPYPRNGIIKIDYEHILIFKKPGNAPKPSKEIKEASKLTKEEWKEYFSGHWYFNGVKQDKHLAMFPEELPKRIIKMFSFVGETVLDPFLGSGTTSLAAKKLDRNSIGYELNKEFLPIILDKLGANQETLLKDYEIEVVEQNLNEDDKNWNDKIKELPYIFKDPVKFDKKIDPKKLKFGSKIDKTDIDNKNQKSRIEYYRVKQVISPELIELNNGIIIRLIGIKEIPEKRDEAIEFLKNKTKNQKVFLKFDTNKYDDKNNLMAYLYLKNKTFINAHLIKNNLVDVDDNMEYIHKNRFLKYKNEAKYGKRMDIK